MKVRIICEDTSDMGQFELAHNHAFVKEGEAWYRDYDRELSLRDLMREICTKHAAPADACEMDDETLDEVLHDNLQFGTDELEGVFALLNMTLWGMADVREWLKAYETTGLPTTMRPEVLQLAVNVYKKEAQVDMAIEEMSELTKALLKDRRAEKSPETWNYERTRKNIFEEIADVIIMLTQLIMIYGGREEIQEYINIKVRRLEEQLNSQKTERAARTAGTDAAQDVLQPAT